MSEVKNGPQPDQGPSTQEMEKASVSVTGTRIDAIAALEKLLADNAEYPDREAQEKLLAEMRKEEQREVEGQKKYSIDMEGEHIPSREEVVGILTQMIGAEHPPVRVIEDEQGLYKYDIEVPGDQPGETIEYSYRRGVGKNPKLNEISIGYLEDGYVIGGREGARCLEGKWTIINTK